MIGRTGGEEEKSERNEDNIGKVGTFMAGSEVLGGLNDQVFYDEVLWACCPTVCLLSRTDRSGGGGGRIFFNIQF